MKPKTPCTVALRSRTWGSLDNFLGIGVMRLEEGVLLNQRKYALKLIADAGLSGCKHVATPMELNHKLTTVD